MKTLQTNELSKNYFIGVLMIIMILFMTSCATSVSFLNSSVVPGASGNVKVKKDGSQNYVIKVETADLAPVESLYPPKQTYVVWMETEKGNNENMGQLKSSRGFLSKQRTSSFETKSPYKPVKIFITAENESNVRYPGNDEILTTGTFFK